MCCPSCNKINAVTSWYKPLIISYNLFVWKTSKGKNTESHTDSFLALNKSGNFDVT